MNLTKKLRELLNQYIDEHKKLKGEYKQKRVIETLYEELIATLNENNNQENKLFIPILLNSIYGNNIYIDEFYKISFQPNNKDLLKQFSDKIINEYENLKTDNQNLKERISRNEIMVSSAYRVIANLKYHTKISKLKNDIDNVKRIISYYEFAGVISNKEELLLINELELHNIRVATKYESKKEKNYVANMYNEVPNILSIGFQEHDVIEISPNRKNTIDSFVKQLLAIIPNINTYEIVETIETYKKYNLDSNEYNYIVKRLLYEYLEELITLYELLIDKDVYTNKEERIDVVKNYYVTLEKYLMIRNYYEQLTEYIIEEELEEDEELEFDHQEEKRLIYSRSEINITKSRLISDMSDIPYEYYDTVYDLLVRFKNGTITKKEFGRLSNHKDFNGHLELRYDQVRIILRHAKDNIYTVLGVFAKKTDKDIPMYRSIVSRATPEIDTEEKLTVQLELAKQTEEELENLVTEKGRKGTR